MNSLRLILQISFLYIFYLIGNSIQHTFNLPIPGSIIGMLLLFIALITGLININWIEAGSTFLLKWLPLIFLPSVVGIITFGSFFLHKGKWLILLVSVNTLFVMTIGALVSQWLTKADSKETL